MSIIKEILQGMAEYIHDIPRWEKTPIEYRRSYINPNTKFPAIVIEPQGLEEPQSGCDSEKRELLIKLYVESATKDIDSIWDFEEEILTKFKDPYETQDIHDSIDVLKYKGTTGMSKLIHEKGRDFVGIADALSVKFDLEYNI